MENLKNTRKGFTEESVDWKEAEKIGLSKELLEKTGNLENFLKGAKTSLLHNLKGDLGGTKMTYDAKFRLMDDGAGKPVLIVHGVKSQLSIPKNYLGYEFDEQDKKNLKQTGELGKVVELTDKMSKEKFNAFIGVDPDTNEVVSMRAARMEKIVPDVIKGVKLEKQDKKALSEGRSVLVNDMIDKNGNKFNAHIIISAGKQGLGFKFNNDVSK